MSSKHARGKRAKTRSKFRSRGKVTVNRLLQEFDAGSKVHINIESSVHSAMPFRRYQGHTGTVVGRRGLAYEVEVGKGKGSSLLIVNAANLTPAKAAAGEKPAKENEGKVAA